MADTYTTALNLTKPEVGASADTWGTKLNTNFDTLDGLFDSGPYLALDAGGTGAGTAADARTNLGLGTMATQAASNVTITGGSATLTGTFVLSGAEPGQYWYESDATAGDKYWRAVVSGGEWYLQGCNDALDTFVTPLLITRTGQTIDSIALTATSVTINGNATYHAGNISSAAIAETQITDGAVLARVGGNEAITGTWSFSTVPTKTSAGKFLHYASSGNNSGAVTVSTSDASGTPGAGDLWIKYVA